MKILTSTENFLIFCLGSFSRVKDPQNISMTKCYYSDRNMIKTTRGNKNYRDKSNVKSDKFIKGGLTGFDDSVDKPNIVSVSHTLRL